MISKAKADEPEMEKFLFIFDDVIGDK